MTILQALDNYYHRLSERGDVSAPGWSPEKFGWCIILNKNGEPVDRQDLRDASGKKPKIKLYSVPAAVKRTVGIAPNFLWDKSAYVLGRTAGEGKRTAQEHEAFVAMHRERLAGQNDEGLVALRLFLEKWTPERFDAAPFVPEMLDANIMFRLEGDRNFLHQRPAARALVEVKPEADEGDGVFCLITGERGAAARLHPAIKGVEGAQSSGAALVSFNLDAFTSLGKAQGENAPTSEAAVFRYGAALNHLLTRDGPNRVRRPIGDTTVVFWADARTAEAAEAAEAFFADALDPDHLEDAARFSLATELAAVSQGRPLADLRPAIEKGTRFHVLGLAPNAARLSVRYWLSDDLDLFARRLAQHHNDLKIEPSPLGWGAAPSVNRLLARSTALQEKFQNIPPLLAGEVMRAVLSGGRYPQSLLAAAIMRLRAGDPGKDKSGNQRDIGWHVAVIRAVLARKFRLLLTKEGVPVSLDKEETNEGYRLGRLFAALEYVQEQAIEGAKATIRSRFLASASSSPGMVFPTLLRLSQHHIVKLTNVINAGAATFHDKQIQEILDGMPSRFPRSLSMENQGRFYIGYYHQRSERFRKREKAGASENSEQEVSNAE